MKKRMSKSISYIYISVFLVVGLLMPMLLPVLEHRTESQESCCLLAV